MDNEITSKVSILLQCSRSWRYPDILLRVVNFGHTWQRCGDMVKVWWNKADTNVDALGLGRSQASKCIVNNKINHRYHTKMQRLTNNFV